MTAHHPWQAIFFLKSRESLLFLVRKEQWKDLSRVIEVQGGSIRVEPLQDALANSKISLQPTQNKLYKIGTENPRPCR
jgi:hypothetical protein